jgi:hypothetical protein
VVPSRPSAVSARRSAVAGKGDLANCWEQFANVGAIPLAPRAGIGDEGPMTQDQPIPPTCPSRRVKRRCVLERGVGRDWDEVLRDVLLAHPNLSMTEAIEHLSEAGW